MYICVYVDRIIKQNIKIRMAYQYICIEMSSKKNDKKGKKNDKDKEK